MTDHASEAADAPAAAWHSGTTWVLRLHEQATPLARGRPLVLGRGASVDIALESAPEDPSGAYARLTVERDALRVEDLGRGPPTFLDGLRIHRGWASRDAVLQVGRHMMQLRRGDATAPPPTTLLGRSGAMKEVRALLRRLAPLRQCVLVTGETGTGKELAARLLHDASPRAAGPFVAINCGAIPGTLAESELFGHRRGAFTGAHRDRDGAFVRARGGTLFLDEVGELPAPLQAKLLRTLEVNTVLPVGAEAEVPVDARVVAATHRDLGAMVSAGELREDLVHRLAVLAVTLPPLRQRRQDIPELVHHFARHAEVELGCPVHVEAEAIEAALRHPWPGNVRALKNAVLRAAAHDEGRVTGARLCATGPWSATRTAAAAAIPDAFVVPRGDFASMKRSLLRQVLAESGTIREAALTLGVPRSTLGNWLARELPEP